jgi:hypothetical protein
LTIATREALWGAWTEWKERCALRRCSAEAGGLLTSFAARRLALYVDRLRQGVRDREAAPLHDAWHLFETHLLLKRSRKGIRYKDWLFARIAGTVDDPLDVVQGGATLILRDVARELWRAEGPRDGTISIQSPLGGDEPDGITLEDLLAGTGDNPMEAAAAREYESLAQHHAAEIHSALEPRERLVVLARALGISFAHPALERIARCGKSQLSDCFRMLATRAFDEIHRTYHKEDRQQVVRLAVITMQRVAEKTVEQEKSERCYGALFSLTEKGAAAPA